MQPLLRSLFVIREAIVAGAQAGGGTLEGRDVRWIVDGSKAGRQARIRLQVRSHGTLVFQRAFSRRDIETWLDDPAFAVHIEAAIAYAAMPGRPLDVPLGGAPAH